MTKQESERRAIGGSARGVLMGSGVLFLGMIASRAITAGFRIAGVRLLDKDQFGMFAIAISAFSLAMIPAHLNVSHGISSLLPSERSEHEKRSFVLSALVGVILSSIAVGLVLGTVLWLTLPLHPIAILIVPAGLVAATIWQAATGLLRIDQKFGLIAGVTTGIAGSRLALVGPIAVFDLGNLDFFFSAHAISFGFGAVIGGSLLIKFGILTGKFAWNTHLWKWLLLSVVSDVLQAGFFLAPRVGAFLLYPEAAADFDIAFLFYTVFQVALSAFMLALMPDLAKRRAGGRAVSLPSTWDAAALGVFFIGSGFLAFRLGWTSAAVNLIAGSDEYQAAATQFTILLMGVPAHFLLIALSAALHATSNLRLLAKVFGVVLVVQGAFLVIAVARGDTALIAASWPVGATIGALSGLIYLRQNRTEYQTVSFVRRSFQVLLRKA